jgi:hypothetical protein
MRVGLKVLQYRTPADGESNGGWSVKTGGEKTVISRERRWRIEILHTVHLGEDARICVSKKSHHVKGMWYPPFLNPCSQPHDVKGSVWYRWRIHKYSLWIPPSADKFQINGSWIDPHLLQSR